MGSKRTKKIQTQYTTDGRDLSHQGAQLGQQSMTNISNFQDNIYNRLDPYMKYVDLAQASKYSDFLKDYKRATAQQTAGNYAATHGGYSSGNQLSYNDLQNYYNDYAARLYSSGIGMAEQMAQNEYNDYLAGAQLGSGMYGHGKEYSDIEQYNHLVDEANKNRWAGILTSAGDTIGSISMKSGNPWVMAIGGAIGGTMGTVGRASSNDAGAQLDAMRGTSSGTSSGQYSGGGLFGSQGNIGVGNLLNNYSWFRDNPFSSGSSGGGSAGNFMGISGNSGGIGNYGLNTSNGLDPSKMKFSWN